MLDFNLSLAVKYVKAISDNTQCVACDKLSGPCVRFTCGHSVCRSCAERTGNCLLCFVSPASYVIDYPQTARLNKVSLLLMAFQDTFKVDVYRRQRISNNLKEEKLIFPDCIQAPYKYCNRRKTLNNSCTNRENSHPIFFSGEDIVDFDRVTMKKSFQYVQDWLNQHENMPQNLPRKPFGNINVNMQSLPKTSKKEANKSAYKKKSFLKSKHKTISLLNDMVKQEVEKKSVKLNKDIGTSGNSLIFHKCDKNESGIVIEDEPNSLEGIKIIDKDEQAWLAILEQAEKDENKKRNLNEINSLNTQKDINNMPSSKFVESKRIGAKNVLFYKRGWLSETCKLCNNYVKNQTNFSPKAEKKDNVSIVISNSTLVTTIQFKFCEENQKEKCHTSSVAIQTDQGVPLHKTEILHKTEMITCHENITPQKRKHMLHEEDRPCKMVKTGNVSEIINLDAFISNKPKEFEKDSDCNKHLKQNVCDNSLIPQKVLVIEDSDTDSDNMGCCNKHEVQVEVHSVDCGVLQTLSKKGQQRTKRHVRGQTPNSSNSSDKENLDPNRNKIMKIGKNKKNKK